MLTFISAPSGPERPYSAAVRAGDFIFVSPQGGRMNHQTNEKVTTVAGQTERCLKGVEQVLKAAGAGMKDVVMLNILITDTKNTDGLNGPIKGAFPGGLPARTVVGTELFHPDMLVMVGAVAYHPQKPQEPLLQFTEKELYAKVQS
jgi:enamine deaminase RidA (YjgF/YER057c/UK114 family)